MAWSGIKRRVFISYFNRDKAEVEAFINEFSIRQSIFTYYAVGINDNDFIDSSDTDYVMRKIRSDYLKDSTVTIVMLGTCTHSRRFIDWEIKSSLRQAENYIPNGLMGIILPSASNNTVYLPHRLWLNCNSPNSSNYAKNYYYPILGWNLGEWIDDAYNARTTRNQWINNPQEMMKYSSICNIHRVTH